MIRSFRDRQTEDAFNGVVRKGFPADLIKIVRRKLGYLNAAVVLGDLKAPPGNRLEALKDEICFIWTSEGPIDVEFTDYH